jgi:hypothetical protein
MHSPSSFLHRCRRRERQKIKEQKIFKTEKNCRTAKI